MKTRRIWSSIESTLARLSEMVGRRLREHGLQARTLQLKLRYSDFSTITRAHSLPPGPSSTPKCSRKSASCSARNWKPGATVRLLGVHVSGWAEDAEQMDLVGEARHEKWTARWRRRTVCGTSSANRRFRWRPA